MCTYVLRIVTSDQVATVTAEESSEAKEKLGSQEFWIPQAGGHNVWLKALCTALLDSGGVRSEALLLSRPLCLVSTERTERLFTSVASCISVSVFMFLSFVGEIDSCKKKKVSIFPLTIREVK